MKMFHIIPPGYMEVVIRHPIRHMMVLGQHLITDPEYREFVRGEVRVGTVVMVDNGAAERDQPPFKEIAQVAHYVGAQEIVLPDALYDMETTVRNTLDPRNRRLVDPSRRVVIPQGRDIDEWLRCYWVLRSAMSFAVLGIPKHLEQHVAVGGRATALEHVVHDPAYKVHMFGIWSSPCIEIARALAVSPGIRSIDSGAAIAYAQAGLPIESIEHASLQWHEPPQDGQMLTAVRNMQRLEDWCDGK